MCKAASIGRALLGLALVGATVAGVSGPRNPGKKQRACS
jgi:hypothetical protein